MIKKIKSKWFYTTIIILGIIAVVFSCASFSNYPEINYPLLCEGIFLAVLFHFGAIIIPIKIQKDQEVEGEKQNEKN